MKALYDDTLAMFIALATLVALSALAYGAFVLLSPHTTLTDGDTVKVVLCFLAALILGSGAFLGWRQWKANSQL